MARASKTVERKRPRFNWRLWVGVAAAGVVCVSTGMAALHVRRFALTDPQFRLSRENPNALSVRGLQYAPRARVLHVFAGDYGRSIFSAPIEERRRRLLAIDWIEDATVLRIWPDRLRVEVRERQPVAFVFVRGAVLLIDRQGILLDPPAQAQFTFPVLSGVREDEPEEQRRERVQAMLRIEQDLGYLAKDVSEINVADLDNIHILAQVERQPVELVMGDGNFARRFQNFVSHFAEIHKRSPEEKVFDLRLDDRITAKD